MIFIYLVGTMKKKKKKKNVEIQSLPHEKSVNEMAMYKS